MKTSWNQIARFAICANTYLNNGADTKMAYAIKRIIPQVEKAQKFVQEALGDIEIDTCVTEKLGGEDVIVRDAQGNLRYTVEGIKKRNHLTRECQERDDIEIEPHIVTAVPEKLSDQELEAFAGFVISQDQVSQILAARYEQPNQ